MEKRFSVGDTVYYRNGHFGVKKCKVDKVSQAVTKDEPLYDISWPPTGKTIVFGNDIFTTAEECEAAAKQRQTNYL